MGGVRRSQHRAERWAEVSAISLTCGDTEAPGKSVTCQSGSLVLWASALTCTRCPAGGERSCREAEAASGLVPPGLSPVSLRPLPAVPPQSPRTLHAQAQLGTSPKPTLWSSPSLPPPTGTGRMSGGSGGHCPFDHPTVRPSLSLLPPNALPPLPFTCQLGLFGMPVSWCLCWRGPDRAAHPSPHSRPTLAWPHGVCGHPHSRLRVCPHPLPGPQTPAHFSDLSSALLPELP